MGFDAGTVVKPLDYTFEPHVKGVHGVIKEPNDRQIADYMGGVKKLVQGLRDKLPKGLADGDESDVISLMQAVDDLDPEDVVSFHSEMAGVVAALCSGDPSKSDILKLPIRIRVVFYGWLQQEVLSPEAEPGAGNGQVVTLPRSAAG